MSCIDNHFLFSETYIKEFIKDKSKKEAYHEETSNAFKQMKDLYHEYTVGDYVNCLWFDYIDTVLDYLGFQKRTNASSRILFSDTIKEDTRPVAICYLIDESEDIASTIKGKYYAFDTIREARKHNTNWAILTDGNRWRLYSTKNISPYENFIEINIEESIKNNNDADEAFKLFYLFFNVKTYYLEGDDLVIEKIKEESDTKAAIIEDTLRSKAEEILKELCYGLKENINKENFDEEEKKAIYNDAIILLYRMLFFGYAESRELLPIVENDPDYTDSFKKICEDAKEIHNAGKVLDIKDEFKFWNRLDEHIRLYVDRSYNGGLFHNDDKPVLREHRISDGRLTKCLAELSYNRDKRGKYTESIEYKDLSVRNLGAIYEGLLEYRLFIAEERMIQQKSKNKVKYLRATDIKLLNSDYKSIIEKGGIYLSQDALERKETGAYYTPEDVVEYIVDNTVGKKIKELKDERYHQVSELEEKLLYEPVESTKRIIQQRIDELTMSFINEKVLSLSIIDSAMGSGHFLVNASYRVANEIVEIISSNNWTSKDDIIVDIKHWKRKVVENCIYGIDINGLSVALTRLSLWLISASNDKALSFIDHHLKEGNSIIGTDRSNVEIKDSKYPLFEVSYEKYMEQIIKKYEELNAIGSATKADVMRQKDIYDEINNVLKITKLKYDYFLASQYTGGITSNGRYGNLLRSKDITAFEDKNMESLWNCAKEKKFFHWELEFPEVFINGGFDIVIGNPPYIEVNDKEYNDNFIPMNFNTKKCGNIYVYFIEHAKRVTKLNSKVSMIIPLAMFCTPRMQSIQKFIKENYNRINIAYFDCRPGTIFKHALVFASIFIFENDVNEAKREIYTTKLIKWYSSGRKKLFTNIEHTLIENEQLISKYSIPKLSNKIENDILSKLSYKKYKLSKYVDETSKNTILYGYGGRNWIKAMDFFPEFKKNGQKYNSTGDRFLSFSEKLNTKLIVSILNSTLFYWYYLIYSDCRNKTKTAMLDFYIDFDMMDYRTKEILTILGQELMDDYKNNSVLKACNYSTGKVEYYEFYPKKSKHIIDNIDNVLGKYYGLNKEEIEFITKYNLNFRMGEESIEEDE